MSMSGCGADMYVMAMEGCVKIAASLHPVEPIIKTEQQSDYHE